MMYAKVHSWHRIVLTFRSGMVKTRCGLNLVVEGTLSVPPLVPNIVRPTAEELPLGEPSCESCLRLTAHDEEPS